MILSRRGVLRCLTGLIAAPAVVKADALMRIVAPKPSAIWGPVSRGLTEREISLLVNPPLIGLSLFEHTIFYGNSDLSPVQFRGLSPFYDSPVANLLRPDA